MSDKNEISNAVENKSFLSVLLGVYVVSIALGLPLVFRDHYFDILIFKYYYYCFCTIVMLVLVLAYFATVKAKDILSSKSVCNIRTIIRKLTFLDRCILIYWFIAVVSTVSSDYLYEAFWGNEGRFTGLFLITLYMLSYFCVSRFFIYKNWYLDLFLLAGVLVCLFGITDYFNMDILNFKVGMVPEQKDIFTSTIGNINTYTSYVGILTAISAVLFAKEERMKHKIFYYTCMIVSFFAIIMGVSDNAYLSLMALFGLLPLYLFNNRRGIQRYLIILATLLTVIQCICWINNKFNDTVIGIDSAFKVVISFKYLTFTLILLWIAILIWIIITTRTNTATKNFGSIIKFIWLAILGLGALVVTYILYDCNIAGNADKYSEFSNYFLFNDEWGTNRGYIWRNAIECYNKLSVWKKLIGYGPETFGILILRATANNKYHQLFDSAHNEYLHTLITVGVFGLTAYIVTILAFIKNSLKNIYRNYYLIAIAFGVICYSAQATVNLSLPIVSPLLWLFLGIGSTKVFLQPYK